MTAQIAYLCSGMENMKSLITVVIPVRDRAGVVGRTLDSVAAQTLRPFSVVLVDNGSTDGTRAVLDRWQREMADGGPEVTVISEPRPGACAARNAGLAVVRTPWVMFFDSDDVMLPGHLARAVAVALRNPAASVVGWDALDLWPGRSKRLRFIPRDALYNNIFHSSFSTIRYMARTDLVRRAGRWTEGLTMYDDCELGVRILSQKPVMVHAGQEITVKIFHDVESITESAHEGRAAKVRTGIDAIRRHLSPRQRPWADFQQLIKLTVWADGDPESPRDAAELLAGQPLPRRLLWRLLLAYVRAGGRGAARIYRPFSRFI